MRRLTYKLDKPLETKYLHYDYMKIADYDISKGNFGRITDAEVYNKLGQYEDLEEELGIDLLTLFKALKDGIYLKEDNVGVISFPRLYFSLDYRCYCFEICFGSWVVKLKDYKKTWWLKKPKENDDE